MTTIENTKELYVLSIYRDCAASVLNLQEPRTYAECAQIKTHQNSGGFYNHAIARRIAPDRFMDADGKIHTATRTPFTVEAWQEFLDTFERVPFTYWEDCTTKSINRDGWRYMVEDGAIYSHPTEHGCQIMIRAALVNSGFIPIHKDNSHIKLPKDQELAIEYATKRDLLDEGKPRIGDVVILPDGNPARVCADHGDRFQTTSGGSFNVSSRGGGSYSGGLDPSILADFFQDTGTTEQKRFWFFSEGMAGAGRGVDAFFDCKVWRIVPRKFTPTEAIGHHTTEAKIKFWGADSRYVEEHIEKLIAGELRI